MSEILSFATTSPDKLAVDDGDRRFTYRELDRISAHVARELARRGLRPGDRVAVHVPTSSAAAVLALACMRAGMMFIPLSPIDPPTRIRSILEDSGAGLVVTRQEREDDAYGDVPSISDATLLAGEADPGDVDLVPHPEGHVYCIYTSGTTGVPKGVVIDETAFWNSVRYTIENVGYSPATRALCISSFHFDGCYGTFFPTLAAGGTLFVLRREPIVLPRLFVNAILENEIDVSMSSPSFFRLLLSSNASKKLAGSTLRTLGFGGEAASVDLVEGLAERVPGVRLLNRYGPTETTIAVSTHEVIPAIARRRRHVAIGRPHPGTRFHLVDADGALVTEHSVVGELYIGGDQLMAGYLGDPALTANVLRSDVVPGETVYRTGDLAYRDEGSEYVYVGRADRVVKRTGVRISLDEIERVLRSHERVKNAATRTFASGEDLRIVSFCTVDEGVTDEEFVAWYDERLPPNMRPDATVVVDDLPLTAAGKVDYRALPEP